MSAADFNAFWIPANFTQVRDEITSDNSRSLSSEAGNIVMPSFAGRDTITAVKTLFDITHYYRLRICHLLMSPQSMFMIFDLSVRDLVV